MLSCSFLRASRLDRSAAIPQASTSTCELVPDVLIVSRITSSHAYSSIQVSTRMRSVSRILRYLEGMSQRLRDAYVRIQPFKTDPISDQPWLPTLSRWIQRGNCSLKFLSGVEV